MKPESHGQKGVNLPDWRMIRRDTEKPRRISALANGYNSWAMITLLRREFIVDLPLEKAWQQLARVEDWPSWAQHIKQVQVKPPGEFGPQTTGVIHLSNGLKSAFTMTEFNPYKNWKWAGRFLWLTVHYDHIFEEVDHHRTKLIWVVEGSGFAVSVFGKLFAKIYAKNLDHAIPLLISEMNTSKAPEP